MVSLDFIIAHINKTVNSCDIGRNVWFNIERLRNFKACNSWLNRVDDIILDFFKFFVCDVTLNGNYFCTLHLRAFTGCEKLDALSGRIGSLVILTGEIFHCKISVILRDWKLGVNIVEVRLWKDLLYRKVKFFFGKTLSIIAIDNSQILKSA